MFVKISKKYLTSEENMSKQNLDRLTPAPYMIHNMIERAQGLLKRFFTWIQNAFTFAFGSKNERNKFVFSYFFFPLGPLC